MQAMEDRLHLDFQRFTFADVGSGKGRALLLACDYPFREIIGIELSPELDRVARANIARYRGGRHHPPVISLLGDAAEFAWPPGPLIVYMWNAFTRPVMERVFKNLETSLAQQPRELYLVYIHPELDSMLAGVPWLIRLWQDELAMSEEDYSAWAFPNRAEVCAVYSGRTTPKFENLVTIYR
jgi:SAM-dependent methyltransferase